ncbi:MAG TPA: hypothetical protein VGE02_11555 [Gemmatimonadales bacterium]
MHTPDRRTTSSPLPSTHSGTASPDAGAGQFVAARERAIRLLTDHYAEGTVDDQDFEVRLARLREASDTAAMEAVVAGLGETRPQGVARAAPAAVPQPAYAPPRTAPPPIALPPEERRILAVANEMRRSGWWEVPRFLRVRAVAADLKLDLRDVPLPAGCTFDVGAYLASVTIIVRPGTSVDFDVLPMLGTAVSRAPGAGPAAQLRVTGSAFLAEVKVIVREPRT